MVRKSCWMKYAEGAQLFQVLKRKINKASKHKIIERKSKTNWFGHSRLHWGPIKTTGAKWRQPSHVVALKISRVLRYFKNFKIIQKVAMRYLPFLLFFKESLLLQRYRDAHGIHKIVFLVGAFCNKQWPTVTVASCSFYNLLDYRPHTEFKQHLNRVILISKLHPGAPKPPPLFDSYLILILY